MLVMKRRDESLRFIYAKRLRVGNTGAQVERRQHTANGRAWHVSMAPRRDAPGVFPSQSRLQLLHYTHCNLLCNPSTAAPQELSRKFDSRAALLRWPATLLDLPPNSTSQEHQQRWGSGEWEVDEGPEYLQEEYWQQPADQQQQEKQQQQEEADGEGGADRAAEAEAEAGEGEGPLRSCANDVLVKDGPEALRWLVVNEWEEVPELGLLTPRQLRMQVGDAGTAD